MRKSEEFLKLFYLAEEGADTDAGNFMLWCDDNRYYLKELVLNNSLNLIAVK